MHPSFCKDSTSGGHSLLTVLRSSPVQTGGEVDGPRNLGIAQRQEHLSKDAVV